MDFHLKDSFGVDFTAYEGQMVKELALTLCVLYNAYRSFAPDAQYLTSQLGHAQNI